MGEATVYHIMHTEKCVAQVSTTGECKIYLEDFMPYDLVLKESNDFDTRINNVISFHSWCASRLIPHDRTYAKEILNSIAHPRVLRIGSVHRLRFRTIACLCWMCSG